MLTDIDNGTGLVKASWAEIRSRVQQVNPDFASIVDQISPCKKYPLYLAYLPYGALKGDTLSTFLPKLDGGCYRLSDPDAPSDVKKDLGYGLRSAPLAMLLERELELFIDMPSEGLTIPRAVYKPGTLFPFARILSRSSNRIYASNSVLTLTSGLRSLFMLPSIGCNIQHDNLSRDFNVRLPAPKKLYDHWAVFRELLENDSSGKSWRSCIMYFSERWVKSIEEDPAWNTLKLYLYKRGWEYSEYERNNFYYNFTFSLIQKHRNLKPNPYLADTAKHLFGMALGASPGFAPLMSEDSAPIKFIQNVYTESYGLKYYTPIILGPVNYTFESDDFPIYYSLNFPSSHSFSPKSRRTPNTLVELRELENLMRVFSNEFTKRAGMCGDTVFSEVSSSHRFDFFHNKKDHHKIVTPSLEMPLNDLRFGAQSNFSADAPFVRGCVRICKK